MPTGRNLGFRAPGRPTAHCRPRLLRLARRLRKLAGGHLPARRSPPQEPIPPPGAPLAPQPSTAAPVPVSAPQPPPDAPVVMLGVSVRFGDVQAMDSISMVVPRATILGVIGPSGAGKTTTIRVLTGAVHPDGR